MYVVRAQTAGKLGRLSGAAEKRRCMHACMHHACMRAHLAREGDLRVVGVPQQARLLAPQRQRALDERRVVAGA